MKAFAALVVVTLASVALASDEKGNGKGKGKGHPFDMFKMQTCIDFEKAKESVASVGGDCAKLTEGEEHQRGSSTLLQGGTTAEELSSEERQVGPPSHEHLGGPSSEEHPGGPNNLHGLPVHIHGGPLSGDHLGEPSSEEHQGGPDHHHGRHHGHWGPKEWFEKMQKGYECFAKANDLRDADNATIIENVKAAISEFAQSEEKAQALSALIDGCNEAKAPTISAADRPNFMECVLEAAMEQNTCMPEMLTTTSAPAEA